MEAVTHPLLGGWEGRCCTCLTGLLAMVDGVCLEAGTTELFPWLPTRPCTHHQPADSGSRAGSGCSPQTEVRDLRVCQGWCAVEGSRQQSCTPRKLHLVRDEGEVCGNVQAPCPQAVDHPYRYIEAKPEHTSRQQECDTRDPSNVL